MKKNDFIIVAVLVAMMFAWMHFYPALEKKYFPRPEKPVEQTVEATPSSPQTVEEKKQSSDTALVESPVLQETPVQVPEETPSVPEQRLTLSNNDIEVTVSSYGGAVVSAVLKNYPETNTEDSGPVVLDFEKAPALRYDGLPLYGSLSKTNGVLVFTASLGDGKTFKRTFRLDNEYLLTVEDSFINNSDIPWALPELRLPTGPMSNPKGTTSMKGLSTLGVDTFTVADGSKHWGRDIQGRLFNDVQKVNDLKEYPLEINICPEDLKDAPRGAWATLFHKFLFQDLGKQPVEWVSAKNKFFVQILTLTKGGATPRIIAEREKVKKGFVVNSVASAFQFDKELVAAHETLTRSIRDYIGPKDFDFLKTQGMDQIEVMEFKSTGFWKFMNPVMFPIKKALLWGLTALHAVVRNYGIAIMLLTIIVRVIFWPITHKGTESMRRMQTLQPQLKEIREKYKDNPQRMQQETMAFYKENKVNPMGGCLPMLIQIPVFIALYTVLRSAIELRFSEFLWIKDLSEPENLFAGMIPFIGSLNILPILMAATMMWQQKLTPTAGDPQQQKMMAVMMPIMMLFFFYGMPSGLVLYWTTSQGLMIVQMLIKRKKQA